MSINQDQYSELSRFGRGGINYDENKTFVEMIDQSVSRLNMFDFATYEKYLKLSNVNRITIGIVTMICTAFLYVTSLVLVIFSIPLTRDYIFFNVNNPNINNETYIKIKTAMLKMTAVFFIAYVAQCITFYMLYDLIVDFKSVFGRWVITMIFAILSVLVHKLIFGRGGSFAMPIIRI
jgi:hypothetical protein